MTDERIQPTHKLRAQHEDVSSCTRRNILAVSAIGGNFLPLLLAAVSYAQTARTVDAEAFVTPAIPAKQTAAGGK